MNNKIKEILQGFNYAKNLLNSIAVSGVENCQKITMVYNNIEVFLNMVNQGEILITENQPDEDTDKNK